MDHNKVGMIKEQLQDLISAADFKAADRILQEYLAQGGLYDAPGQRSVRVSVLIRKIMSCM